jgi:hypothetical protein
MTWTQTFTGKAFEHTDPSPAMIDIVDVAHGLAHQCRFNGHLSRFYSVAEHSVYVSMVVPSVIAKAALLHDAAETWMGDLPQPIKGLHPQFAFYEAMIMRQVHRKFHVPLMTDEEEKILAAADRWMAYQEVRHLSPNPDMLQYWPPMPAFTPRVHLDWSYAGLLPEDAKVLFLRRFAEVI